MIALFDSGNSRIHFSWRKNGEITEVENIEYPSLGMDLEEVLKRLFDHEIPEKIAACSVSSRWRERLFDSLESIAPGRLYIASKARDAAINVQYEKPDTIGIDRALAGHAAWNIFRDSCVVVDAGTAVTVDAVSSDGTILGGYIFPGISCLCTILSSKSSLPDVEPLLDSGGIGISTKTCLALGISSGFAGAVTRLIENACQITGSTHRIVITGGGAKNLLVTIPYQTVFRPNLVLEGLGLVLDKLPKYKKSGQGK
jgi:type III pantothenate kinase